MIFAAYFILRGLDTHIDFLRLLFLVGVICPLIQEHSLRLKKLISQASEDSMLKIRRPVYKRLFKSNRVLRADQESDVNQTCQQSVFLPMVACRRLLIPFSPHATKEIGDVCTQAMPMEACIRI